MEEPELELCRKAANSNARRFLSEQQSTNNPLLLPVSYFACHPKERQQKIDSMESAAIPDQSPSGHPFLTPAEEAVLISFYASKLPRLIGPAASLHRLKRDSKVLATATMLYRRFFLSNSVMLHDPKAIMVAAAFLGSKTEDAMCDVRYLEQAVAEMNTAVLTTDIVAAELELLQGVDFYLLCFHPYKAVLALTEDLRTFFKTAAGKTLLQDTAIVTGNDLKPVYDAARVILDDVVVSDIPLQYSPGQIGMAALTVAVEVVRAGKPDAPTIDLNGYLRVRFPNETTDTLKLEELATKLRELKEGKHGCGNYHTDLAELKGIHKKLKRVKAWGEKKKSKKRKEKDADNGDEEPKASKRAKVE